MIADTVLTTQKSFSALGAFCSVAIFCMAMAVYAQRRERGFLVLGIALGLQAIQGVAIMFGLNPLMELAIRLPTQFLAFLVILIPSLISLLGWALLTKKPSQPPEPMAPSGHGSS